MSFTELEEQQENLRRLVDTYRTRNHESLKNLSRNPYVSHSFSNFGSSSFDPICTKLQILDNSDISNLIISDNDDVSKFVTVLAYDCIEIARLSEYASKSIYKQLFLFGHTSNSQEILLEGEPQKAFGRSFSLFMELYEISYVMSAVTNNLLQQLDSIYSSEDKNGRPNKSFKNITLKSVFSSLGDGLAVFLLLDEILAQNGRIRDYLSLFIRMLNKVKQEPENIVFSVQDLESLNHVAGNLEILLESKFFNSLFHYESPWNDSLQKVKCNKKFFDACTSFIQESLSEILPELDTHKESSFDRKMVLSCMALFVFSTRAAADVLDKRLGRSIMEMIQTVPVIYLGGGIRCVLLDLLRTHCPPSIFLWSSLKEASREHDSMKNSYLIRLNEIYSRDWQSIKDGFTLWISSFQSYLPPLSQVELSDIGQSLSVIVKVIIKGIQLAKRIQLLAISLLDLHGLLEVPMKKEKLQSLCYMFILLKVIESTFHKKTSDILLCLPHIINHLKDEILHLLLTTKDGLQAESSSGNETNRIKILSSIARGFADKGSDARLADTLSLVLLSLRMLQGGGSHRKRIIFSVALDAIQSIGHVKIDYSRIKKILYKMDILSDCHNQIQEVTSCAFLYWKKEMMGTWLSFVYSDVHKSSWLQYLLDAFSDEFWLLKVGNVPKPTLESLQEEIRSVLHNEIIGPLCRDIETDLRLHVHSAHLKGSVQVNPTKTGVRNLSWFLQLSPLRLPLKYVDIKFYVENFLNSTFYNHAAVSSYNWKIYTGMRQLAETKYRILLDDINLHLPENSLDCHSDMTKIFENLHIFSDRFSYSLCSQVLIENNSNNSRHKTQRIVGVEDVVTSFSQYGPTMVSTFSNSALNFLKSKISGLAEFLQDNFLTSQSIRDAIFGKEDKKGSNRFLLVQLEEHNIRIGNMLLGEAELSFLEKVRNILNEIGNVLGLLRILLTAGSRQTLNAFRFQSIANLEKENIPKLSLADERDTLAGIMDMVIDDKCIYERNMFPLSHYVTTISKEIQEAENNNLKEFFLIVPALIMVFLDNKVHGKEKILRKAREIANQVIMCDGFVMGIAFVLMISRQHPSFDSLQWFSGAKEQIAKALFFLEETRSMEQRKTIEFVKLKLWGPTSPILTGTQKSIDKLEKYQKELELVEFILNISRTLMS